MNVVNLVMKVINSAVKGAVSELFCPTEIQSERLKRNCPGCVREPATSGFMIAKNTPCNKRYCDMDFAVLWNKSGYSSFNGTGLGLVTSEVYSWVSQRTMNSGSELTGDQPLVQILSWFSPGLVPERENKC